MVVVGVVGVVGVEGVVGTVGVVGVVGAVGVTGVLDLQTEGCPEQVHPVWILQPEHPAEGMLPVSQVSVPTMRPSPH